MRGNRRFDRRDLIALNIEQEHVGRIRRHAHRELIDQVLLQRSDADDEEAAEADGEQHDSHLAAGPAQLQHGVTQREGSRSRERPDRPQQQRAGKMEDDRGGGKARCNHRTDPQRARLPHRQPDQPRDHDHGDDDLREVGPSHARFITQQQRRLDVPHIEQRHQRKQQRHEQADAETLDDGRPGKRVGDLNARSRAGQQRRDPAHRQPGEENAQQAAGQAEHRDLRDIDRECWDDRAPTHFNTAMLFILLHEHAGHADTPMPPRITITRPTRLR